MKFKENSTNPAMLFTPSQHFHDLAWQTFANVSTVVPSPDIGMLGNEKAVAQFGRRIAGLMSQKLKPMPRHR